MSTSKDKLLKVAFEEIYQNSYHTTSVDKILKIAKMNKGSMYHFFKSKKELTLGVIDVHVKQYIENKYGIILEAEDNYIDEMMRVIKNRETFNFIYGCRLNNLVQELSAKDEDFKIALEKEYFRLEEIIEKVLIKAQENNEINHPDIKSLAIFVVASLEGCLATAKKSHNSELYVTCISQLENYLNTLKPKK